MMLSPRVSLLAAAMAVGGFFASPAHALTATAQPALLNGQAVAKPVEQVGYRRYYGRPYRYGYRRYPVRRYYGGYYRPYRRSTAMAIPTMATAMAIPAMAMAAMAIHTAMAIPATATAIPMPMARRS